MKKLENKLKLLQKQGYETISINHILQWMAEIKRDVRLKRTDKQTNDTGKELNLNK